MAQNQKEAALLEILCSKIPLFGISDIFLHIYIYAGKNTNQLYFFVCNSANKKEKTKENDLSYSAIITS